MLKQISEAQRLLLQAAAARDDRLLPLPTNLKGAAARKIVVKLIDVGWINEVKAPKDAPVWRRDAASGGAFALKLTAAGLKAIAAADAEYAGATQVVETVAVEQAAPTEPSRRRRHSDTDADRQVAEAAASQIHPQTDGASTVARAPREGSKLDRVLGMLSTDAGATIAEIIAATNWLPHSTRAVLTGLRKRGYELSLTRGEREGASVYRIAGPASEPTK